MKYCSFYFIYTRLYLDLCGHYGVHLPNYVYSEIPGIVYQINIIISTFCAPISHAVKGRGFRSKKLRWIGYLGIAYQINIIILIIHTVTIHAVMWRGVQTKRMNDMAW